MQSLKAAEPFRHAQHGRAVSLPDGKSYEGEGLTPDIGVPPNEHADARPARGHSVTATVTGDSCLGCVVSRRWAPFQPQDDGGIGGDEDCLTLNVWTSQSTGNVVVTFNYRLGLLGLLTHRGLTRRATRGPRGTTGSSTSWASLRWVQDNIAAYWRRPGPCPRLRRIRGGTRHAGAPCLFARTRPLLEESGGYVKTTRAQAQSAQVAVVQKAGCTADVVACLRGRSAASLDTQNTASASGLLTSEFNTIVDGYVLPRDVYSIVQSGTHNHVAGVWGSNADETSQMAPPIASDAQYRAALVAQFGPTVGGRLFDHYPASNFASPREAFIRATSDVRFICAPRRLMQTLATRQSEPVRAGLPLFFTHRPGTPCASLGAFHRLELNFVFDTLDTLPTYQPTASDHALAASIQGYWARFARRTRPMEQARQRGRRTTRPPTHTSSPTTPR